MLDLNHNSNINHSNEENHNSNVHKNTIKAPAFVPHKPHKSIFDVDEPIINNNNNNEFPTFQPSLKRNNEYKPAIIKRKSQNEENKNKVTKDEEARIMKEFDDIIIFLAELAILNFWYVIC